MTTDYTATLYGATASVAFGYTGKPTDAATGLYYSGARFYDPASGRFMTLDSSTGSQTAPLTLNRYIYACDDPMSVVDPTGHFGMPPPDMAKGNTSPNSNPIAAISNWWSGLPPAAKIGIVVGVGIVAGFATCGLADVAIGAVAAAETTEVAAGGTIAAAGAGTTAETGVGIVSLSDLAGQSALGAVTNLGATEVKDLATGTTLTTSQVVVSLDEGALGGAVGLGLTAGTSTLAASVAAFGVGTSSTNILGAIMNGDGVESGGLGMLEGVTNGGIDGSYNFYYNSNNLYPSIWDFAFGLL